MDHPKKRGGSRPGSGRKAGGRNALPLGFIPAVKALQHRVPDDATPEVRAVAARSFERLIDVMEERVHFSKAGSVLKAATVLREEICGAVVHKVSHGSGPEAEGPISINLLTYGPKPEEDENDSQPTQPAGLD